MNAKPPLRLHRYAARDLRVRPKPHTKLVLSNRRVRLLALARRSEVVQRLLDRVTRPLFRVRRLAVQDPTNRPTVRLRVTVTRRPLRKPLRQLPTRHFRLVTDTIREPVPESLVHATRTLRPWDNHVKSHWDKYFESQGQYQKAPFRSTADGPHNVPVAFGPGPLWLVLREDMAKAGISVRRLATLLHERVPAQSADSWRRTLSKYRDEDAETPTVPSKETAALLGELLGHPAERYIRQQERETVREERDRLREEIAELRRLLGRGREAGGSAGSQS